MTYGTSHLLIGVCVGGVFSGGGSRKKLLCKGGGAHYMKNKNKGDVYCQLNQKRPQCKNAQKIIKH